MTCQDGVVGDGEVAALHRYEKLLELPSEVIRPYKRRIETARELQAIRAGQLPIARATDLMLKSTEQCHWRTSCTYSRFSEDQGNALHGELIVTNRRIVFVSNRHRFEARLKAVISLVVQSDRVIVGLTSNRASGDYIVPNPEKLGAVIETLVKRWDFRARSTMDATRSRHIPDDVKVEVWQRDRGVCVRCGAQDDLQFDHIIPFSKGGSNSAANIQLLCRKCNLAKGAELV